MPFQPSGHVDCRSATATPKDVFESHGMFPLKCRKLVPIPHLEDSSKITSSLNCIRIKSTNWTDQKTSRSSDNNWLSVYGPIWRVDLPEKLPTRGWGSFTSDIFLLKKSCHRYTRDCKILEKERKASNSSKLKISPKKRTTISQNLLDIKAVMNNSSSQDIQSRREGMVIRQPLMVLVCLAIVTTITAAVPETWGYNGTDTSVIPGIQGDALSADPLGQPIRQVPSRVTRSKRSTRTRSSRPAVNRSYGTRRSYGPPPTWRPPAQAPQYAACPPQGCAAPYGPPGPSFGSPLLPPLMGLFSPFGINFAGPCNAYLPRPRGKQFHFNFKVWRAKLNSSTMLWGTNFLGSEGTELDLHENLGLRRYECRYEVEARYNIRNNWGLRFSFMPINYRDNHLPANGFYWGYAYFPPATQILTKWDRYIYRYDMVYDWHRSRTAVSSIFAGANIYDDKLTISNAFQRRSRSQGFALVSTGASIEKIIRPIKRATVSMKCKWSIQWLNSYVGWDGYAAWRVAVPMECGRFGYLEAGWRWIVLERDEPSNIDKTSLDGCMATAGLVF
jgi:hypothetical protein